VRRLLIEEASRQFTQRGYAATTVKDLSAATGVAISVLYNHFPSKADLLREAVLLRSSTSSTASRTWPPCRTSRGKGGPAHPVLHRRALRRSFEHRGALLTLIAAQAELERACVRDRPARCAGCFLELARDQRGGRARGWHPSSAIDIEIRLIVTWWPGRRRWGAVPA